ncbi:MAG: hypothetical protein EXR93_09695 [Gemmatimonadetes bacterium]|nr:hypothetical protein [Gemmatimonadota bacterium]
MRQTLGAVAILLTVSAAASAQRSTNAAPGWFRVDHSARTVTMTIAAEQDASHISWNLNGFMNGNGTITVPEGYGITINFFNLDNLAHSIGVLEHWVIEPSATPDSIPAFPGAVSSNATSSTGATREGASETITFVASRKGRYVLMCLVPSFATGGMWINFNVAPGREAGVRDDR